MVGNAIFAPRILLFFSFLCGIVSSFDRVCFDLEKLALSKQQSGSGIGDLLYSKYNAAKSPIVIPPKTCRRNLVHPTTCGRETLQRDGFQTCPIDFGMG
jgi:hypothetical protein